MLAKISSLQRVAIRGLVSLVMFAALINITPTPLLSVNAAEHDIALLSGEELVQALRQGGFTIYFRHEATDWSQTDNVLKTDDWLSCDGARFRQLSAAGRQSAVATGRAIHGLGIPVGRVLASPYCRTVETATLMNLGKVETTNDVINMRIADYFGGRSAIVATARALLSTPSVDNTNTVIVAHGNVAQASTPVYPGEGEGVVFEADGKGGFRFIGRLMPGDWRDLAEALGP